MKLVFIALLFVTSLILTFSLRYTLESQKDYEIEWIEILESKKRYPNVSTSEYEWHSQRIESAQVRLANTNSTIQITEHFVFYFCMSFVCFFLFFRKK